MANVTVPIGTITMSDGETVVSATVVVDDTELDPEGHALPTATLEGPFTVTITGPGAVVIDIWRGTDEHNNRNPWRTSESLFPGGITAADSPVEIQSGGPVKNLDDVTWRVSAAGQ